MFGFELLGYLHVCPKKTSVFVRFRKDQIIYEGEIFKIDKEKYAVYLESDGAEQIENIMDIRTLAEFLATVEIFDWYEE